MTIYKFANADKTSIIKDEDGIILHIPTVGGNRHYQEFLEWEALGNVAEPFVEPPAPVPQSLTRFQALAVLLQVGLLDEVEAMMAAPETDRMVKIAFENAQSFERTSPTLLQLAAALGLTDAQLDQMFIDGSKIVA